MKHGLLIKILQGLALGISLMACKQNGETASGSVSPFNAANTPSDTLNVAFLAINGVYNSELMAPFDVFQHTVFHTQPGMNTFIVSPSLEPVETFEGIKIIPDYSFDNVPPVDVLVVPSAENNMGTDLQDTTLISFVREKGLSAKYIMSLCDGAFILAQAGLLDEVKCTTFPTDIEKFRRTFPQLSVQEGYSFVHDGKAITSSGGAKSYDPAMYLVEYLYGQKVARGIGAGLVIDWKLEEVKHLR